jgi:predicted CXXCH cytochrome family protein
LPILPKEINATCLLCHEDKNGKGFAFSHKAIEEKTCTSCHNPHGSDNKELLKISPTFELCLSCHNGFRYQEHGGHQSIIGENKSCFNCHESHFAHEKNLLKRKTSQLCLQCHDKEMNRAGGQQITNIKNQMDISPHKHKPFAEGKCQSCHKPHGSGDSAFLLKTYTKVEHPLCLECHKNMDAEERTIEATQFRNGNLNLHYFHLHGVKNPLNCQTCHEVHASNQEMLIRASADYNFWKLPIQYRKLPEGGTCLTACHKDKVYSRTTPFVNEAGR